jgi:ubiquinone/menaquinone biosynthesis C-methylase UbiE
MALREHLLQNPSLIVQNNIFYQKEINRPGAFEKNYIRLREKESRVYTDEIVKELPQIPDWHPLRKEWSIRRISLEKLIWHLKRRGYCNSVLELGCGNGWLAHHLAASLKAEVCAMDVNAAELSQGSRIFASDQNLTFIYADIFTLNLGTLVFDTIILASSIQYFPDLKNLVNRLLGLLTPDGEIHIVDSPFYAAAAVEAAKKRSYEYFHSLGFSEMTTQYFHHMLQEINKFNYQVLFNPNAFISLVKRKILRMPQPVFPWIVINRL